MGLPGTTFKESQLAYEVHPLAFVLISLLLPGMWAQWLGTQHPSCNYEATLKVEVRTKDNRAENEKILGTVSLKQKRFSVEPPSELCGAHVICVKNHI